MKVNLRADGTAEVSGYVNAVGRESRVLKDADGYFTETIAPGAFARALRRGSRKMLLNHDRTRVLADDSSGLELAEDAIGLYAKANIADAEVVDKARNGELRGWSFGFKPLKQASDERAGMRHRTVFDMELFEVSVIDQSMTPCYEATSVFTRAEGGDDVEYRAMESQTVSVSEESVEEPPEPPDMSGYMSIIEELSR